MNLLVLVDFFSKKPIHVNVDKITLLMDSPSNEGTIVHVEGLAEPLSVEETIEEIAQHANG